MQTKNAYHTFGANSENRKEEIFTMKTLKKFSVISAAAAIAVMSTACGNAASTGITVISREDGSGTRSAFIELTGVEEKDADGNKTDKTTVSKLSGNKKYYVRVRSYTAVNGTKYYGAWSASKSVTTKK